MRTSVSDCETNQASWNAAIALAGGGEVWDDGGLRWSWQAHDRQLMLNFPQNIPVAAVRRGVIEARRRGARIVGAWLATEVDASPLECAGFETGWQPWWMAAPLAAIAEPDDKRVTITAEVPEYDAGERRLLSLVEDRPGPRGHRRRTGRAAQLNAAEGPVRPSRHPGGLVRRRRSGGRPPRTDPHSCSGGHLVSARIFPATRGYEGINGGCRGRGDTEAKRKTRLRPARPLRLSS